MTGWGGARAGAGRPAKQAIASEPHQRRPELPRGHGVHVVARVVSSIASLRGHDAYAALDRALQLSLRRADFRIVRIALRGRSVELIVEADDRIALARGMQGFEVSAARALNRACGRRGTVFADRYRPRTLVTRAAIRSAVEQLSPPRPPSPSRATPPRSPARRRAHPAPSTADPIARGIEQSIRAVGPRTGPRRPRVPAYVDWHHALPHSWRLAAELARAVWRRWRRQPGCRTPRAAPPPPQPPPFSTPFSPPPRHAGAAHAAAPTLLVKPAAPEHPAPSPPALHAPPQSTSVSSPFGMPSVHDPGDSLVEGPHAASAMMRASIRMAQLYAGGLADRSKSS